MLTRSGRGWGVGVTLSGDDEPAKEGLRIGPGSENAQQQNREPKGDHDGVFIRALDRFRVDRCDQEPINHHPDNKQHCARNDDGERRRETSSEASV